MKTKSELLFEGYLKAHGITDWDYEPDIEDKSKKIDYFLDFKNQHIVCDVKEFRWPKGMPYPKGAGAYDPYKRIREKVLSGRKKFKEYREFPCVLVLHNVNYLLVDLQTPWIVQSAMLGNLAFQYDFDREKGMLVGEGRRVFSEGGMMIDYDRMEPENTTISAIVTLGRVPVGQRRLSIEIKRIEKELGRSLTFDEHWEFIHSEPSSQWISVRKKFDLRTKMLRVIVHENPFARKSLTRELFRGPYDARFGLDGERMTRLYAGEKMRKLEQEEACVAYNNVAGSGERD